MGMFVGLFSMFRMFVLVRAMLPRMIVVMGLIGTALKMLMAVLVCVFVSMLVFPFHDATSY